MMGVLRRMRRRVVLMLLMRLVWRVLLLLMEFAVGS